MDKADIKLSKGADATAGRFALWAAVLRKAVVVDRDLTYLDSPDFHFICGTMGMDPSYAARKLRAALANKGPKLHAQPRKTSLARDDVEAVPEEPTSHHRPRAKRTHSEATRQKIKAAIARRHADSAAYEEWRTEISEGQKKRWARIRRKMEAA